MIEGFGSRTYLKIPHARVDVKTGAKRGIG